jgi:hypothetical protein
MVLEDTIDIRKIIHRIKLNKVNLFSVMNTLYNNYLKFAQNKLTWKVEQDKFTPARDSLGDYADNKWLVDIARRNLKENIKKMTKQNVEVPLTVFNAMHDGGFTTCSAYNEKLWKNGQNAIVIGTGDFSVLHDKEYITPEIFLYGILEFKNLLKQCFIRCAQ